MTDSIYSRRLLVFLGILGALARGSALGGEEAKQIKAGHSPVQPRPGEAVTITVNVPGAATSSDLVLQYQVVEPGKYIDLKDPAFEKEWTNLKLAEAPASGLAKGVTVLTATLPGKLQENRRLLRYRVYSSKENSVIAPAQEDTQKNYAYFVYDGIPEWRAAINPNGRPSERQVTTFGREVMRSVQAYHLISKRESIENVTWREPKGLGSSARHDYNYTGTLVSDGKVYDHVRFRARGGNWRHAMGKNMWKIDFTKGHHLEARDDYGRKYEAKWNKLNLGACIQQADYGMRGEHGMFEALAYRLFNLAGSEAPHTHWAQLRIVDGAEENPADQYRGDFWGLYLATEEVDEDFLEEHALPDGNLYKMEFGDPKAEYTSPEGPVDHSDAMEFVTNLSGRQRPDWWRQNVDLSRYYSYRAIVECIHHYDIGMGKNYFFYHNLKASLWQVIPWDVDLTWSDLMFGNGAEPFYRAGLLRVDPFKSEYQQRLAEIRDLLFNPEQAGALIDEYAAIISAPKGKLSMVDADRAKWDYHPIMSSEFVRQGKADPGRFYESSPTRDFAGMVKLMKLYVQKRGKWVDETLLADASFAETPQISQSGKLDLSGPTLKIQLASSKPVTQAKWRIAEVASASQSAGRNQPGKYEIQPIWESSGGTVGEAPTHLLVEGRTYRARVSVQDANGRWSRWSAPLEFTMKKRAQPISVSPGRT